MLACSLRVLVLFKLLFYNHTVNVMLTENGLLFKMYILEIKNFLCLITLERVTYYSTNF